MGYAGNNDPQFIIPSAIATREAPSASTSGFSGRVGGQSSVNKKGSAFVFYYRWLTFVKVSKTWIFISATKLLLTRRLTLLTTQLDMVKLIIGI